MQQERIYMAGLYLRLSKDDENKGESVSIGTQRAILTDFCIANHYSIHKYYMRSLNEYRRYVPEIDVPPMTIGSICSVESCFANAADTLCRFPERS